MKRKIKLSKGLQINKEHVSKLQEEQMSNLRGGNNAIDDPSQSCKKCSCSGITQNG